jgi:hypothetical protein
VQLDLLAAAHPQQPVHGRVHRLLLRERVQVDHGALGEQVPLVRMAAEGHGSWHAPRPPAGREQAVLVAQVTLELGEPARQTEAAAQAAAISALFASHVAGEESLLLPALERSGAGLPAMIGREPRLAGSQCAA